MTMKLSRADFPKDFLFGTATSAYQIEGHAEGGAGVCEWDTFAAAPGNVANAEDGAIACDHLHRWEEDLDLVAKAGFDVYRFSTSWARVMPEGTGAVNAEGLDFYDRLVDGMLARGIKPALTLYHWELPAALADKGGFRNRDIAAWMADYAEVVMDRIGDRVWSTAVINEPWCVAWLSHFMGAHAPGLRDIRAAARAMHHVLLTHGTVIARLREKGYSNLGSVVNSEHAMPADDSAGAAAASARYDAIYTRFYLSGLFRGEYPPEILEGLGRHLPEGWQDDLPTITTPVDWLGLNYYTRKLITAKGGPWPDTHEVEGPLPKTAMDWEIFPDGLLHLIRTAADYAPGIPLYVTENGMASYSATDDQDRIDYIDAHLARVKTAVDEGIDVAGYFVWSLLDNYEWSRGYDKRFGLVHVDFDTMERTPKASWHALAKALGGAA